MEHTLEWYRQAAADSDDSDCDLLKFDPVFKSRKKPKQHETDSPTSIVSLSQSSLESNNSVASQQGTSRKPALTEEQIEIKAQEMIKDLMYPGLGDINRKDWLGWHKAPKQKRSKEKTWYPCRRCFPDESIGLIQNLPKGKIMVRYLGYQSDTAQQYACIKRNQFIPLTKENREIGLDTYARHLKTHFKDNEVGFRAEVLAVRAMWKKVAEREEILQSEAKSAAKKATKTRSSPSTPRQATLMRKPSDCGESSDEGSSDSDLELSDTGKQATSKKRPLQAGDVIEYYDPIGVAGKSQWQKTAAILGVVAKGGKFPLNLDTGDLLDRRSRVKRVKRWYKGKLEMCHNATFKDIHDYGLKSSGTKEMIGINAKVERAKQIRKDFDVGVDRFWKGESPENNEEDKANTNSNATISTQTHVQNEMAMNSKYVPRIQPDELEVVLRVWECLHKKVDAADNRSLTTTSIIPFLASRLKLELTSLDNILCSNKEMTINDAEKTKVIRALECWLEDPTLDISQEIFISDSRVTPGLVKGERSRRLGRPLAQRNQNTSKEESKKKSPQRPRSKR